MLKNVFFLVQSIDKHLTTNNSFYICVEIPTVKRILCVIFLLITLSLSQDISNINRVRYDTDLDNGNVIYESDLIDKSYSYSLQTAGGQIQYQRGHFEDGNLVVEGAHEYIGEKGFKSSVTYIADKNGSRSKVAFGTKLALPRPVAATTPPPAPKTVPPPTRPTRLPPKPTKKPRNLANDVEGSAIGGGVKRSPKIDERDIMSLLNTFFKYFDNENSANPRF